MSKVLWAGLRVGWIRAARPVVERLMRLKIGADMGSPIPSQTLTLRVLPRIGEAIEERRAFGPGLRRAVGVAGRAPARLDLGRTPGRLHAVGEDARR